MHKTKTINVYECDQCGQESQEFQIPTIFPAGWQFHKYFSAKLHMLVEKHYCSEECILAGLKVSRD